MICMMEGHTSIGIWQLASWQNLQKLELIAVVASLLMMMGEFQERRANSVCLKRNSWE